MKRIIVIIMVLTSISGLSGYSQTDPSKWNSEQLNAWFVKGDWHKGWAVTPDPSINKLLLAKAYFKNPDRWNKAFAFLKEKDMKKLELKRYDIDGDNLYVSMTEYNSKDPKTTRYEAHKKYIDIQYVVSGNELIGVAPLSTQESILQKYDEAKDIEFLSVKKGRMLEATPSVFFVFFPEDAHMPGLMNKTSIPVRKAVVKIKID
jgi:YhcH/YjgK/YiaL family protein